MLNSSTGRLKTRSSVVGLLALAGALLLASACTVPPKVPFTHLKHWKGYRIPGAYYVVERGDTLRAIADYFQIDVELLANINNTTPNRTLGAAEKIFIPRTGTDFPSYYYAKPRYADRYNKVPPAIGGYRRSTPPRTATPRPRPRPTRPTPRKVASQTPRRPNPAPARPTPSPAASRRKGINIAQSYQKRRLPRSTQARVANAPPFQWPAAGVITSRFNASSRNKRLHMGVDVASKTGTPIRASLSGRVLYSDSEYLPSMGNMILIEHTRGWVTLYGHNQRNLVKEGAYVRTGQAIALMGSTGRSTGPHLHFEIRKNAETPVDPLAYLPRRQ